MKFILQMAVRETRAAWRRLLFFFVCIAVGVAAIVALRSVIQSVRDVFGTEAKALVAADVTINTTRDWTPAAQRSHRPPIGRSGRHRPHGNDLDAHDGAAGRRRAPVARMVELKAVQREFPFYGSLTLEGGQTYSHALAGEPRRARAPGAADVARPARRGRRSSSARRRSRFAASSRASPAAAWASSTSGRACSSISTMCRRPACSAWAAAPARQLLVKVPDDRIDDLVEALRADLRGEFAGTRSYRSNEDQIGRDFDRAENYLSLVGLIIVILGGIAVSSVTRVFILQKIRSIAVLKCVGARSRQIIAVYILQVMALGLAGSLLGVLLARLAVGAIPLALGSSSSILAEAHYGVTWSAALQGVGIGVLVSLLFSVVPLLHVRFIKPSLLLREESTPQPRDWVGLAAIGGVATALVALTIWQAASLRVGLVVCAGFAGLAFVLHWAGRALVAVVAPLAKSRSFPLRHAVLHLSRPGNQTRVILLAVGLGAFFIVGIRSLQASLLDEFSIQVSERFARHVPARHPEDAGRRRPRVRRRSGQRRGSLAASARPAGARGRRRRASGSRRRTSRTCGSWVSDANTRLPIAITSSRTSASSRARSGTARRRRLRCRSSRGCTSGPASMSATRCASIFSAASSAPA